MSLRNRKPESAAPAPRLLSRDSYGSLRSHVASETEHSEIHSPTPRRHHAFPPAAPWLLAGGASSYSPMSSRAGSPSSTYTHSPRLHTLSFSALKEHSLSQSHLNSTSYNSHHEHRDRDHGLARRAARWMRAAGLKQYTQPVIVLAALLVRWAVGLGSYSGFNSPPMYGDYEAQRHWMELTLHLPMREWYTYDLQYWGLDYPPLTAYVSWLCGAIGAWINPDWFALDTSRGLETPSSKVFMRGTVLLFDAFIYIPALLTFVRLFSPYTQRSHTAQHAAVVMLLFQPALLLVDFGHFQYNSVMLGLVVHALNAFAQGRDLWGAVFFVGALGFKQMALYFSPAVFGYLLGRCFALGRRDGFRLFVQLGAVTSLSFAVLFLPWLLPPRALLDGPLTRIFPLARGLFEDKVANFWCASDVVLKWRRWLPRAALLRLSTLGTALGFAPALGLLVRAGWRAGAGAGVSSPSSAMGQSTSASTPGKPANTEKETTATATARPSTHLALLPYALFTTALSFFLFGFQVHEKSILLPLLPLALCMAAGDAAVWEWGVLVQNVGVFSMWPLLKKDGLGVQYVALTLLWNYLVGHNPFRVRDAGVRAVSLTTYTLIALLHTAELALAPPARYPDLFPVLNVLLSAAIFSGAWVMGTVRLVQVAWALGGPGVGAAR